MMNKTRFEREIIEVENLVLEMGHKCCEAMKKTIQALEQRNSQIAQEIVDSDKQIDSLYKEIESKTFRILLLDQPVARDFLETSSALKMITDLERIGDYCVDIAEEILSFPSSPYISEINELCSMGHSVETLVNKSIEYYEKKDYKNARQLVKDDDRIDDYLVKVKTNLVSIIKNNDGYFADFAIIFMMIAKYFERIGDHAVNIGEWVDYASTGSHEIS